MTGYQVDTSTGYLIHPGTGYLIEPVTGNLVNPTTWEYTGLIWDPETGEARDPSAEPSPTPTPSATPTASTSPSSSPSATAAVGPTASPSATGLSAEVANSRGGNGWAMRGGVVVLLIGAGALYYLKLRGSGPAVPVRTGKTEE
ncbi:hypothetical protein [Arthrobacter zhangbolii]|uniref:Uncharacterized protein n=1 Tax=Arthrobacter zhangbolii TaxID=2886936 RepID=A0A9X1M4A7_9MICC|nr:hypothetical protein [Arthrobacter zhangbolii]MCC3271134.1 hypothetical protein [Arthrobacter zhangbolii]